MEIQGGKASVFLRLVNAALAAVMAFRLNQWFPAPCALLQNPLLDGGVGVLLAQTVQTNEPFGIGRAHSGVLILSVLDLVAGLFQRIQKCGEVEGCGNEAVNVATDLAADGGLAFLLCLPFLMGQALALGGNDGQAMLPAQIVGNLLHLIEIGVHITPQLFPILKGNGIDHNMIV